MLTFRTDLQTPDFFTPRICDSMEFEVEYLGADRSAFAGGESFDQDLKLKVAELVWPAPLANYLTHVVAGNLPISDLHGSSWIFMDLLDSESLFCFYITSISV